MNAESAIRFRYFKRYCLEFDYDWDRLELVEKKFATLPPNLQADFDRFARIRGRLADKVADQ